MIETIFAWALLLFAPLVFAYAGSSDIFNMRISNRVALIFMLPFPFFAYGVGMTWNVAFGHLGVAVLTLVLSFTLWMLKAIGGGDAKFAAVAALWMGPELALIFFALTSVYGAMMAIFFLLFRSQMLPAFLVKMGWAYRLHTVKRIPYGVAFAIAGLQIYAGSDWMETGIRLAIS